MINCQISCCARGDTRTGCVAGEGRDWAESKRLSTKSTDWCTADHLLGRALRKEKRGPRMLARTWTRRASCGPGGGRLSSNPERPCPGVSHCGGFWSKLLLCSPGLCHRRAGRLSCTSARTRHLAKLVLVLFRQQGLAAPDGPRLLSTTFVQTAMRSHWSSPWYYSRAECSAFSAPSAQGYGYRFQLDWVCARRLRPLRVLLADSRHLVRAHRHERLRR